MDTNFHEVINENAPRLKNPHFVVDYEVKDVEKPFPIVASCTWCFVVKVDLENHH